MAHIHEKIDFTVSVFVVCKDRVLIRKHEKYHIWIGVGGHIELDEDANATALREVKEEVGLDVTLIPPPYWTPAPSARDGFTDLIPPLFLNIHPITEIHQHHDLIFVARAECTDVIPENETDEWVWLTKEEVEQHLEIDPAVKHYACAALDVVNIKK